MSTTPNAAPPAGEKSLAETIAELPPNIAAGLAAILPPLSGVAFLILDRSRPLVRFHALQNIIFGAAGLLLAAGLNILRGLDSVPLIGGLFAIVTTLLTVAAGLVFLGVYAVVLLQAFMGAEWQIPKLGALTRAILSGMPGGPR